MTLEQAADALNATTVLLGTVAMGSGATIRLPPTT